MKPYSKLITLFLFLLMSLTTITQATQKFIGLGGGYTSFSENYATTYHFKGTFGLLSSTGIMYDLSMGYAESKAEGETLHLKMAPILVGASYIFNPKKQISPYVGAAAGMNILPSNYSSPGFTFGGKAGLLFKIDRDLTWFLEASYLTATDSETDLSINPFNLGIGLTMNLNSKHQRRDLKPHKKKRQKSDYQTRKERRRRRAEKRRY
ncbi:hypothetical protein DID80_04690 [Candidatus Marinamargulisbacteria bacterium SCGC AAA071-K20]|nr:hypothetical protein DID80_04690 [Candidatus Marinamargulisbacteria bacterium SCGC AAA071-K20]